MTTAHNEGGFIQGQPHEVILRRGEMVLTKGQISLALDYVRDGYSETGAAD